MLVSGVVGDEKEGVEMARKSLRDGGALRALEKFRDDSQEAVRKEEEERKQ